MNSNSQAAYSMIVLLVLGALVWFLTSQNLIPKEYRTSDAKVFTSLGGVIVAILAGIVAIVLFYLK